MVTKRNRRTPLGKSTLIPANTEVIRVGRSSHFRKTTIAGRICGNAKSIIETSRYLIRRKYGAAVFSTARTNSRIKLAEVGQPDVCLMYRGVIPDESRRGTPY